MDLLLRRLGRRDDATVSNSEGDHLDADELSAYAESALPAAARARYTAHLAECTRCRELIVQLSPSTVVVSGAETATASEPSVWRRFLSSLFTPMVLRYAAPALGLIVVAAIGFLVLRRDRSDEYVTQVTNNEQRQPLQSAAETSPSINESESKTTPSPEGLRERQKSAVQADSGPVPPPPNAAPVVSLQTEVSKDAAAQSKSEQQPTSANEPPRAKPIPTPEESARVPETEVTRRELREVPAGARTSVRGMQQERDDDRKTDDVARTANKKAEPTDAVRTAGAGSVAKLQVGNADENKAKNAETRSVAGRRFRKQGSIWIDTAYDASRDTMTMARGSERYRALIADEPEIKRIADELDGEIIVVWKGRAYRIR
jgi:hypothetical protein